MIFNRIAVPAFSAAMLLAALTLPEVESQSPYVINDARVQNLDVTPTLGRGYSIMTNSYQSTCLLVEETNVPSYNYDCKIHFSKKVY